jgi:hypothetical protein
VKEGWLDVCYRNLNSKADMWRCQVPPTYQVPVRGDVVDFGVYGRFQVAHSEWFEALNGVYGENRRVVVWCVHI